LIIIEWQKRPLDAVYPIIFIDAIHFNVKSDGIIVKKAVYIVLAVNSEGTKEVVGIYVGENESSKFWLGVLNDLKNRGVKDILILCADALSGMKEPEESINLIVYIPQVIDIRLSIQNPPSIVSLNYYLK